MKFFNGFRRWLSIRRLFVGLAAVVGVCLLLVLGLLGTGPGLALVAAIASSQASSPGQQVTIQNLDGVLSGNLRVGRITLGDSKGVWLSIDNAAMDWSPLGLISGTLVVDRLAVERIAFARTPVAEEDVTDEQDDGGTALLRLDVNAIALKEIALGAPVLGEPVTLTAQGSAYLNDDPASARIKFNIDRRDGTPGSIRIAARYAPESEQLDLDVSASEPEGGAMARLLKLPGLPAVDLRLAGKGTLKDWSGDLQVALNGQREISGTATISSTADERRLEARLAGRLGPFVPPEATPLLAGRSEITLDVTEAGRLIRIDKAALRSETAAVDTQGTYSLESEEADIQLAATIASEDTQLQIELDGAPLTLGHTRLQARIVGPVSNAGWRARASLARLETADAALDSVSLEASGVGADLNAPALPFDLELSANDVALAEEAAADFVYGATSLSAKGAWRNGTLTLETAQVKTGFGEATVSGRLSGDAKQAALQLQATLRETRNTDVERFLEAGPAQIAGSLERDGETFQVNGLSVQSPRASVTADATLTGEQIEAQGRIAKVDLAALDARSSGRLTTDFTLTGTLSAPRVTLTASGENVVLLGKPFTDPALEFTGTLSKDNPSGTLKLSGALDGQPVRGSAELAARSDGPSRADNIDFSIGNARIEGALTLGEGNLPEGKFTIDIADLSKVAPLLLQDGLSGEVRGDLALENRSGRLGARLNLQSPALRLEENEVKGLRLQAEATDVTGALSVTGDITATRIAAGGTVVEDLDATARNEGGTTQLSATARLQGKPARLSGSMTPDGDTIRIALDEASATYEGIAAKLKAPARLAVRDGTARIEELALALGKGEARISGSAGEKLDLKVRLASLPASIVNNFAPDAGLSGTVSGNATITGAAADPSVDFNADWSGATAAALREVGAPQLKVSAKGSYGGKKLNLNADISGGGLSARVSGNVGLAGAPQLNLTAKGGVPLSIAQPMLARSGIRLGGDARIDLAIKGSAEKPQITGQITASNALFVETGSGFALTDIAATIAFAGNSARITRLTGKVGEKGSVQVSGTVGLDASAGLPADLTVKLDNVAYSDGRTVTAVMDGNMTLTGALLRTPTLGGEVTMSRTNITIPSKLPQSLSALDVDHVNAPANVRGQSKDLQEEAGASGGGAEPQAPMALALTVSAPRRIYIRGRGMNAELGGQLRLTGALSAPQALGAFELIKGRFDILTKRLAFTRGRVTLTGSLDPTLDFAAQHTSDGYTTGIEITGRASDPKIRFTSTPALPEDEVMARFFFDKSLASLSPVQLAQLANAVATLTGATGSGGGIMGKIRNLLGVDTLDVTADGEGSPEVSAGRYIGDKTYVGVKQGTDLGSSSVTTNIDLTDTLKLKGEIDAQGKTKAGIFVEKDY